MRWLSSLALLLLIACGDDDSPRTDGGARDAGTPSDAGGDVDAERPVDVDGGSDGGTEPADASAPRGAPIWVGVGSWGYRTSTRDGVTWATVAGPEQGDDHTPDLLRDVAVGGGAIVAVGGDRNSMVMRSVDGERWDEDLHPSGTQWLGGVAYGDGLWLAGGGVGTVVRSSDGGRTWTSGASAPAAVRDVAFGDGRFVAVGDGGMIAVTSDGTSWTDRTRAGAVRLEMVAFHAGTFVVAGSEWNGGGFDSSCFVSRDTETWTPCPFEIGRRVAGVFAADGRLVVALDPGHQHSTDGLTWTRSETTLPGQGVYSADGRVVGADGERRYAGSSIDSLAATMAERGLRAFAFGRTE